MISKLIAGAVSGVLQGVFGRVMDSVDLYMKKQITEAELKSRLEQLRIESATDIEKATLEAATKSFAEFQGTVRTSPIVQRAYVAVMVSQLFVLIWAQLLGPVLTAAGWSSVAVPADGVNAALWLLVLCLGGGPFVFRAPFLKGV